MSVGDWIAVGSAATSVFAVIGAYLGAKRGAAATVEAATLASRSAHVANLIAIAQGLTTSDQPEQRNAGYRLLLVAAQTMASMADAPTLIQGVTRTAELQLALAEARNLDIDPDEGLAAEYGTEGGYL